MSGPATAAIKHHANLCVGGPMDGKSYVADRGGFKVPVASRQGLAPQTRAPVRLTVEHVFYVECAIQTPDGEAAFWVPEGMTALEMLDALAKGYGPYRDLLIEADRAAREQRRLNQAEQQSASPPALPPRSPTGEAP